MIGTRVLDKYLVVEGFRNIKIDNIDRVLKLIRMKAENCQVQVVDTALVAGFEHVYFSVLNALKSFKSGVNISKSLAVEVMLFISGQDQIRRAIEILGVKPSSSSVAVILIADSREEAISALDRISSILGGDRDQGVIELTEEKIPIIMNAFAISNLEIEAAMRNSLKNALKSILIERGALLVTQR